MLLLLSLGLNTWGQVDKADVLYKTIKQKDSLLFDVGFNTCDLAQFEKLVSEKFEFYHDQGGITPSKAGFVESVKNGICGLAYQPKRRLVDSTMHVFPLYDKGVLYGAIQTGDHRFFALEKGMPEYLTGLAKFTHLWLLEGGEWKLSRGLSYDHREVEKPIDQELLFTDRAETARWLKQKGVPAMGIGYVNGGKMEQATVFGELEKGRPAPHNTVWNVASLTKPVTALVTLKLIDAGKLGLDEPLHKYFTDPDVAANPWHKKLTPRIVLSHQTGFPNWRDGKLAFDFEPGTGYRYSGEGYEYLRKALENKFGKTLPQLANERLFTPLGMADTRFVWNDAVEPRFARWHREDGTQYTDYKTTRANAADNLLTTVNDYCKLMQYVLDGAGLSQKLYAEMTAEQVRVNPYKHFGLGWCIDERINENNDFAITHGGNDIGVRVIVFILPQDKRGLLIFTNTDNGTSVFADVLLRYLGKEGQGIFEVEMK